MSAMWLLATAAAFSDVWISPHAPASPRLRQAFEPVPALQPTASSWIAHERPRNAPRRSAQGGTVPWAAASCALLAAASCRSSPPRAALDPSEEQEEARRYEALGREAAAEVVYLDMTGAEAELA